MISFKYALSGIINGLKTERNFKFMGVCCLTVIVTNSVLNISKTDWIITLICCGCVLSSELFNSAIETCVDLLTLKQNPLAKKAKDFAAGAVLIVSFFVLLVSLIIYIPYILLVFERLWL